MATKKVRRAVIPDDEFNRYLGRIGQTPKERWKWMLDTLNEFRRHRGEGWLTGDWENLRGSLAVFSLGEGSAPGWGAISMTEGILDEKPSVEEAKAVLTKCVEMVERVADRKPIELEPVVIRPCLLWLVKRYVLLEEPSDRTSWTLRVCYPLAKMVSAEGQRINRCLSKLPHDRKPCRNLFLKAKRGRYCSRACSSREQTRRFRGRAATPTQPATSKGVTSHGTKRR